MVSNNISKVDTREPEWIREPLVHMGWLCTALITDFELGCGLQINPLVERKTLKQLLTDLSSGVLIRQLRRLVNATPFPILMIEGHWRMEDSTHLLDTEWTWEGVWNELESIQDIGCRLQLTVGISHTLERLPQLVKYYSKSYHNSVTRRVAGDYRLACLCLITGIGEVKAQAILKKYPTLLEVASQPPEALNEVSGIGEDLSCRIHEWFRKANAGS